MAASLTSFLNGSQFFFVTFSPISVFTSSVLWSSKGPCSCWAALRYHSTAISGLMVTPRPWLCSKPQSICIMSNECSWMDFSMSGGQDSHHELTSAVEDWEKRMENGSFVWWYLMVIEDCWKELKLVGFSSAVLLLCEQHPRMAEIYESMRLWPTSDAWILNTGMKLITTCNICHNLLLRAAVAAVAFCRTLEPFCRKGGTLSDSLTGPQTKCGSVALLTDDWRMWSAE